MKKLLIYLLLLSMSLSLIPGALAEDTLSGKYTGTLKVSILSVRASATFNEDGTFSLSAMGINCSGTYTLSGNTLTVTPVKPAGFATTEFKVSFGKDGKVTIKGSVKDSNQLANTVKKTEDKTPQIFSGVLTLKPKAS